MTPSSYDTALKKAAQDLEAAIQERDRWNLEVGRLNQLVTALSAAVGVPPLAIVERDKPVGFTEVVLAAVTRSHKAMSAQDVKTTLASFGHDLSGYSNPLAHIHQTLKRLAAQNRIVDLKDGTYKRTSLYEALLNAAGDVRPRLGNPNPTNTQKAKPLVNVVRDRKEWEKNEPK